MSQNHPEPQTTNHVLMIEPATYYCNPETQPTNQFQHPDDISIAEIHQKALQEFRAYRDTLVSEGINVTTFMGHKDCPDHIFPNWFSTHPGHNMILYPMLTSNRRAEARAEMVEVLKRLYDVPLDMREVAVEGECLEATASLVMDRVNKIAFMARSARSSMRLAEIWCERTGYCLVPFQTQHHSGIPLYHTDLIIWIGRDIAAAGFENIVPEDRDAVRSALESSGRKLVSLSKEEIDGFCGNALAMDSMDGRRLLTMSSRSYESLSADNRAVLEKHFDKLIHSPLTTIEYYGGGAARCMLSELF